MMGTSVEMSRIPSCNLADMGGHPNEVRPAFADGATKMGPWAYMCESCFAQYGLGLGTGVGQKLILKDA